MKKNLKKMVLMAVIFFVSINTLIVLKAISQQTTSTPVKEPLQKGEVKKTETGRLDLNFKNADIRNVLRLISEKSNINIIAGNDVTGTITISLKNVKWDDALQAILNIYDYGYEKEGDIISVMKLEKLSKLSKAKSDLAEVQPVTTEIFKLKYLDASDAASAIGKLLSPRGSISIVKMRGQRGWKFGSSGTGGEGNSGLSKLEREEEIEENIRSKVLLVRDIPPSIDAIREVIEKVDIKPQQILIEAKILEVNHDKLKDIGLDWGFGTSGAETTSDQDNTSTPLNAGGDKTIGGGNLGSQIAPSIFNPESSNITGSYPYNTGLSMVYKKLTGTEFEAILHALSEKIQANTLSSPRVVTLNNQEATILVGTKYPILETNVSGTDSTTTTSTLDYYQDIGIQLNVVPQICDKNDINMIIHPAVTSWSSTLSGDTSTIAEYPIITTREAQTQVIIKDGETVVIGGLLKNIESKGKISVPLLGNIPLLGLLFQRETTDIEKIDLVIFVTAHIIDSNALYIKDIKKFNDYGFKSLNTEEKTEKK